MILNEKELKQARRKWKTQEYNAIARGVLFEITFEDWLSVWLESGHWYERGKGNGAYCMCRKGDTGPYSKDNVRIDTIENNSIEAHKGRIPSVDTRVKMSEWQKGKRKGPYSEDVKVKMRTSRNLRYCCILCKHESTTNLLSRHQCSN